MRVSSSISSGENFYTDLNGFQVEHEFSQKADKTTNFCFFQMIRRKRYAKLPLQANFYPLPSLGYVQDAQSRCVYFYNIILIYDRILMCSRRCWKLSFNYHFDDRLSLVSSQPLGGTSGASGQIEVGFKDSKFQRSQVFFLGKKMLRSFFLGKKMLLSTAWRQIAWDDQNLSENTLTAKTKKLKKYLDWYFVEPGDAG